LAAVAILIAALALPALSTARGGDPAPGDGAATAKKKAKNKKCKRKAKRADAGVAGKKGKKKRGKCKRRRPNKPSSPQPPPPPVDAAPVAVADAHDVAEDSGAAAIPVLANDTDADGGPKTIVNATDPANGTVVVTGGGSGLSYQPDPDYCNEPPGSAPDVFAYTLNGGSTAMVSVTVACVDDAPIAVDDSRTVAENSSLAAVPVLANDTDIDGGPMNIVSKTNPANGTVFLTGPVGAYTGISYQPANLYCNSQTGGSDDTFTYTLNGGSTATVSVYVTCSSGGGGRR
jgi:Bacterial cadherin-like domain